MNKTTAAIKLKYAIQTELDKVGKMSDHISPSKFRFLVSELVHEPDNLSESIATYVESNMLDMAITCINEFLILTNLDQDTA